MSARQPLHAFVLPLLALALPLSAAATTQAIHPVAAQSGAGPHTDRVDAIDRSWGSAPDDLDLDLDPETWPCDEAELAVRRGEALECELELDDFDDCAETCAGILGDSLGGALTSIGSGCQLICTCYDADGVDRGTVPGNDTHILDEA